MSMQLPKIHLDADLKKVWQRLAQKYKASIIKCWHHGAGNSCPIHGQASVFMGKE